MTIVNQEGIDALVSQWQPGEAAKAGVLGIWNWDLPEYNWFVIKFDLGSFTSSQAVTRILQTFLIWQLPGTRLEVRYAPASHPRFLAGEILLPSRERGMEYSVEGITQDSAEYLLIHLGKEPLQHFYPVGGTYVPERFPPLGQLAKDWTKERILSETERSWLVRGPSAYQVNRDSILISELASRGFTRDDLERLLLAPNPPSWVAREQ